MESGPGGSDVRENVLERERQVIARGGRRQEQKGRVAARGGKALLARGIVAREERDEPVNAGVEAGGGACRRPPHTSREKVGSFPLLPLGTSALPRGSSSAQGPSLGGSACSPSNSRHGQTPPVLPPEPFPSSPHSMSTPEPAPPSLAWATSQP